MTGTGTGTGTGAREIPYRGVVTFWSLAGDLAAGPIDAALKVLGLERYSPSCNTPRAALRLALRDAGKPSTAGEYYIRDGEPTRDVAAHFSLMTDDYDADGKPVPRSVGEARLLRDGRVQLATANDAAVAARCQYLVGRTTGVEVGQMLVAVADHYRGSRLRSTGGIYWLPESAVGRWGALADAVAAAAPGSQVYRMRQVADVDSVAAIVAAFRQKVTDKLATIDAAIGAGKLGERAIAARRAEAGELRREVAAVEAELGVVLADLAESCRQRAEVSEAAASAAAVAEALADL